MRRSLPGLAALWLVALATVYHRHGTRVCAQGGVASLAIAGGLLLLLDRAVFTPPPGYASISAYVWTVGSPHSGYLFANGPNVWTFLTTTNRYPSDVPLYGNVTPRELGFTAAGGICLLLGVVLAIYVLAVLGRRPRPEANRQSLVATHLVFIGLTNLVVPFLATGTHERHFFHAFPFLVIGLGGWRATHGGPATPALIGAAVVSGFVTGCFVYSIIRPDAFGPLFILRSQTFTAAVLLGAGLVLCLGFCDTVLP